MQGPSGRKRMASVEWKVRNEVRRNWLWRELQRQMAFDWGPMMCGEEIAVKILVLFSYVSMNRVSYFSVSLREGHVEI